MNPGPVEETVKVADNVVRQLGQQPALLALIVSNIALLIFVFYSLYSAANFRDSLLKQQFEYHTKVSEILSRCVVPGTKNSAAPPNPSPLLQGAAPLFSIKKD